MQQQLDVQSNFAQLMFETVRKGDIEAVKRIERRIGLDIQFLIDGNMKQNANFAAMKIGDEQRAISMV